MEISLAKAQLRKELLSQRPQDSEGLAIRLIDFVSKHGFRTISSYQPLNTEPDVSEFNSWANKNLAEVWFPIMENRSLSWGKSDFEKGKHGIFQPKKEIETLKVELAVIPALAIDKVGNRLGKGEGYYDRALESFAGKVLAVVFDSEIFDTLPSESHDRKVDFAITPKQTLVF